MVFDRVQSKSAKETSGSTSPACTFDDTPTEGSLLVAYVAWNQNADGHVAISGVSSGWTLVPTNGEVSDGGDVHHAIYYKIAGASESSTFSATLGQSEQWGVVLIEYSGSDPTPLDVSAQGASTTATTTTGTTATTAQADELWLGFITVKNIATQTSPTNGFASVVTDATQAVPTADSVCFAALEKIVSATGTANTGTTLTTGRASIGTVVTFKAYLAPPVNTLAPVVSGLLGVGEELSTTDGTWTGDPTIVFTYQWQSSPDGSGSWANIGGATNSTYTLAAGDSGEYIRCRVTGTNGVGDSTASSNVVGPVVAVLPPEVVFEVAFTGDPVATYNDTTLNGGPAMYLRLSESAGTTATDTSGNANHGTYAGSPTLQQTGPITGDTADKAVLFDGVDDKITVTDHATLDVGNTFTIEFWAKWATIAEARIFDKTDGSNGWFIKTNVDGRLILGDRSQTNDAIRTRKVVTDTTAWHHVVATWNGVSHGSIYYDGVDVTERTDNSPFNDTAANLIIGFGSPANFNGYLDEIAIYDDVKSAAWAAKRYAQASETPATFVWTDASAYALEHHTRRGVQFETNQIESGVLASVLDNTDRRFDPTHTSSPYYPDVVPRRQVRLKATYDGSTYHLYRGYSRRWPLAWEGPGWATTSVAADDGILVLNVAQLPAATYASELSGARITRVLNAIDWPRDLRSIETGQETLPALTVASTDTITAFSHLQDVAISEGGFIFLDGEGRVVFHDRQHRSKATTVAATFGDSSGQIPYEDLTPDFDDELLNTEVRAQRSGGVVQVRSDAAATLRYGTISTSRTGLWTSDARAGFWADWRLAQYKDPLFRIDAIQVDLAAVQNSADFSFATVLALEIGNRVRVQKTPPGGGSAISHDYFVDGIQHDIGPSTAWTMTLRLAPAARENMFVFNDLVNGKFNTGAFGY